MKIPLQNTSFPICLSAGLLALACLCPSARATSYYWDTSGSAADAFFGGDGTWSASDVNWNSAATNGAGSLQAWANSFSNDARFLNLTSGTVTVSGTVQATSVSFGVRAGDYGAGDPQAVYTLNGGTLNLKASSFGVVMQNWTSVQPTTTINSAITLFDGISAGSYNQVIRANGGSITINGGISDISNVTGAHTLSLESFGGSVTINGDITRSGSTAAVTLSVGGATQKTDAIYTLGGNNSGILGTTVTLNRGTLVINNSSALGTASGVTVTNANAGTADTAKLLIGTGGVTLARAVSFDTLGTDTTDVRVIGGANTSGTATFSGTITLNAFAGSGTGSSLQIASASGGVTVFSGNITDGSNSVALLANGGGVVKFTRAAGMNYDGGTTVASGTLLVNNTSGSGTGTGAVTVQSGALFGGSGSVSGAITLQAGAAFSPGDGGAGVFSGGSSLTWNSDGSTAGMRFDLGADQGSSDQLVLAGAFAKGSGSSFIFDFQDAGVAASATYTLVSFGSTDFTSGDFVATGVLGSFAIVGNELQFTTASIPEPSSCALMAGLGGALVFLARRRRD